MQMRYCIFYNETQECPVAKDIDARKKAREHVLKIEIQEKTLNAIWKGCQVKMKMEQNGDFLYRVSFEAYCDVFKLQGEQSNLPIQEEIRNKFKGCLRDFLFKTPETDCV